MNRVSGSNFSLSAFFQRMGIKNPHPTIHQSVQPVVSVGDFSDLTPQLLPPTFVGGGSQVAVVAEYSCIQITARAPGGCLLRAIWSSSTLVFGIISPAETGLNEIVNQGPLSSEASAVLVEKGAVAVTPFATAVAPHLRGGSNLLAPIQFFIPPGKVLFMRHADVNQKIDEFGMIISDVPASEQVL